MKDEFVDVNEFVPNWNPRSAGTNKEGNRKDLEPTDASWITGWYLGSRNITIENRGYDVHKILASGAGNPEHLAAPMEGDTPKTYEFFGTGVLTSQLAEHVQPGQYVRIQWLGLTKPKKAGGKDYHNWKVGVSNATEPIAVQNGIPISGTSIDSTQEMASNPAQETGDKGGVPDGEGTKVSAGDDLPF